MNILTVTIVKSLIELGQGLDGSLSINDQMEAIMGSFMIEQVPLAWAKFAYPSTRTLGSWVDNLKERFQQLEDFKSDPNTLFKVT